MAAERWVIYALFDFFIGTYFFVNGLLTLKKRHLVETIRHSKIRSVAIGLIELFGEVSPYKRSLKSPLSQKDCVFYMYLVEEYFPLKNRWETLLSLPSDELFWLKDSTGAVLVDPKDVAVDSKVIL